MARWNKYTIHGINNQKCLEITFQNVTLQSEKTQVKEIRKMKKGIHPANYRTVAFKDMSNGHVFITKSTVATKEVEVVDGVEMPIVKLEISSMSHPFYTGKMKLVDTAGRVDKFMTRYGKHMDNRKK